MMEFHRLFIVMVSKDEKLKIRYYPSFELPVPVVLPEDTVGVVGLESSSFFSFTIVKRFVKRSSSFSQ